MTDLTREQYEELIVGDCADVLTGATIEGDQKRRIIDVLRRSPEHIYGETLNCAFCDKKYEGTKPIPRDILEAHIRVCEKHPLTQELVFTRELLARAVKLEWDHHVELDLRQLNLPTNR